jgi:ribosomal protein L29
MPNKAMTEVAGKSLAALRTDEQALRKELFDLQFQRSTKGLEDKSLLTKTKKRIARNLTAQRQQQPK